MCVCMYVCMETVIERRRWYSTDVVRVWSNCYGIVPISKHHAEPPYCTNPPTLSPSSL